LDVLHECKTTYFWLFYTNELSLNCAASDCTSQKRWHCLEAQAVKTLRVNFVRDSSPNDCLSPTASLERLKFFLQATQHFLVLKVLNIFTGLE